MPFVRLFVVVVVVAAVTDRSSSSSSFGVSHRRRPQTPVSSVVATRVRSCACVCGVCACVVCVRAPPSSSTSDYYAPFRTRSRSTDDTLLSAMNNVLSYVCLVLAASAAGVLSLSVYTDDPVGWPRSFGDGSPADSPAPGAGSRSRRDAAVPRPPLPTPPPPPPTVSDGNITSKVSTRPRRRTTRSGVGPRQ